MHNANIHSDAFLANASLSATVSCSHLQLNANEAPPLHLNTKKIREKAALSQYLSEHHQHKSMKCK